MDRAATLPAARSTAQPRGQRVARSAAWIVRPLWSHRRALAVLNATYFGTAVVAAAYARLNPAVQTELLSSAGEAFSPTGALGPLVRSYTEGQLVTATALTFLVNLVLGSVMALTLPSSIVPFAGVAVGLYRACLWGILFSPTAASAPGASSIVALPTILLEGEAYIIAMLGVWVWWWTVVRAPAGRWRAWRSGFALQARIYPAVALVLLLAATCEVLSVVLLLSP